MIIELEPSFWNRTGRRNDNSARGHETAQWVIHIAQPCKIGIGSNKLAYVYMA